jgi:3-hydroxyacyl-CoA dehydrogenase
MATKEQYVVRDGIAFIRLDNPPVNSLSAAQRAALQGQLDKAVADTSVKAIVIAGTEAGFCGGAEIREFNTPAQKASPIMPELIEGLDTVTKPVVAAISGFAYGAGLELALACHYRIATPEAKLGLPEIKFGFLPGAGGTQRLPRLVKMDRAAAMMLSGEAVGAKEALQLGLIDELVEGELIEGALRYVSELLASGRGIRRTRDLAANMNDVPADIFDTLYASTRSSAQTTNPRKNVVDCCVAAATLPFEEGRKLERERFLELLDSAESKALRHIFFAERLAAKFELGDDKTALRSIKRAAVIGAGTMGSGIAICFVNAGIPVTLIDARQESLSRGIASIESIFAANVKKGKVSQKEAKERLDLIVPTLELEAAESADVIVEAAFEKMEVKQTLFRQIDKIAKPGAILATNTSMLDINAIADVTSRPQDVIGMHFFAPANIMRLLEVVNCRLTGKDVVATVMQLAKKLGKAPVLSGVCDGFIGNRMLQRYQQQSYFLLDEGCAPHQIDEALKAWGMAMGPFAVSDVSGLDVGYQIRQRRYVERPDMTYSRFPDRVCEAGRLGQKAGKGWYRYEAGSRKPLIDPEIATMLAAYRSTIDVPQREIADSEIVDRMMCALINEAAWILQEKIARRASDVDVVYTTGYGFPTWRGGPMHYANSIGLDKVLASIRRFQEGYQGAQWQPAPLLVELAEKGERFS